jgi:hypothetical protein
MTKLEIRTNISEAVEKSDARYPGMAGIHAMDGIADGQAYLAATNGRVFAVNKTDGHVADGPRMVPAKIAKRGTARRDITVEQAADNTWNNGKSISKTEVAPGEYDYRLWPQIQESMLTPDPNASYNAIEIDADYLIALINSVAERGSESRTVRLLVPDNPQERMFVDSSHNENFGVLASCANLNEDEKSLAGKVENSVRSQARAYCHAWELQKNPQQAKV